MVILSANPPDLALPYLVSPHAHHHAPVLARGGKEGIKRKIWRRDEASPSGGRSGTVAERVVMRRVGVDPLGSAPAGFVTTPAVFLPFVFPFFYPFLAACRPFPLKATANLRRFRRISLCWKRIL